MKKVGLFFFFLCNIVFHPRDLLAATTTTTQTEVDWQKNMDEIIASCAQQKKKDAICDSVVIMKQIGNDSVEFIKEYMQLTPLGYATLTVLNFAATGRLRIKTESFMFKKTQHVYDYQMYRQEVLFLIEKNY